MKSESLNNRKEEFNFWARWLKQHYEAAEGESIARKALYEQYVEQCQENKKKPMSAALLGVIVNATFKNLGMKRLGSRGKSEYYYWGMRLKKSSLKRQEDAGNSKVQGQPMMTTQTKWRQWLLNNYYLAPGVSMPRSAVYDQLQWHSHESNLEPISSSTLGKLINSVFPGIMTRRLGTRGNSEYHYWGLQLKEDSPLMRLRDNSEACPIEMEDDILETDTETTPGSSEESGEKSENESEADVGTIKKARGSRASRKKSDSGKRTRSRTLRR